MLNPDLKLNSGVLQDNVEKKAARDGYGDGLLLAGEQDERVVALSADLVDSTKTSTFAKKFPARFIEVGIAEQNLVAVASGMAAMGKIPFAASYAMFSPGRSWEQLRTTVCYNARPVKIIGSHAGLTVGPDGGTHQALEDIAITRVLPNMNVIVPCDYYEAKKATLAMAKIDKPFYMRFSREKSEVITREETPFEIGKSNLLWNSENPKVAIIACGIMVAPALRAAALLSGEGIESLVLNMHTIKPIDISGVLDVAKRAGRIVTVEEHQIAGGMGSAVAEVVASKYPVPIEFLGVKDRYGQSGEGFELLKQYGLTEDEIRDAAKKVISR